MLQVCGIINEVVGMDKHLQMPVPAQVEHSVLIDRLRLGGCKITHHEVHRLLVVFHELRLGGVGNTTDAWRQDIVDGTLVVVFLNIHRTDLDGSCSRAIGQGLLIDTPFATHQIERAEAQHHWAAKLGEKHAHEADAGEVVDIAHPLVILAEGNAKLIPPDGFTRSVAQRHRCLANVGDMVISQAHILWAYADTILVIAFVFVEGIVLIDILHIGRGLIAGIIAFGLTVGIGRIALRHVDSLIAFKDGGLALIVIATTVIVVVVVCGVGMDGGTHTVIDLHTF